MSLFDQQQLLGSIHPFELLGEKARSRLFEQLDIAYYPKDTLLIGPNVEAVSLYIVIKGTVYEHYDGELHNVYGPQDSFDANALIYGKTESRFIVEQDLICYELPKPFFLELIQEHDAFQSYFLEDFVDKHRKLKQYRQQNTLTPFMVARISEIYLHAPCIVSGDTPIRAALEQMKALQANCILVEHNAQHGIITDTNLRDHVLLGSVPIEARAAEIATFPLITIQRGDFLFNALLVMTKHEIKRLAVMHEGVIVGMLEQIDLLSFFASHSHLIVIQIDRARTIEELQAVQENMLHLVRSLHSKGVKVRYISKLVNTLNLKIYQKVYEMSVPESHRERAALIVMGSEGRGEQILRTDQDNGLILGDAADTADFEGWMQTLNETLATLGFPPCPGNVMVTNPYWRRDLAGYKRTIDGWMEHLNEAALQALAVFLDAQCAAGDTQLLSDAKSYLFGRFEGRHDLLAHLARPVLSFETPLSLFSNFVLGSREHKHEMDLKKGGIFPIVHGVRILALEHRLTPANTTERIKALNNRGVLDKTFAHEMIEAYDTLLSTLLKVRLLRERDFADLNYVDPAALEKSERDMLKDSLKVVNKFKKFLTFHYHLDKVT